MAITVVATGSGTLSASRSPAITFASYTPATNDVVVFLTNNGASVATPAFATVGGWVNCHPSGGNTTVNSDSNTAGAAYHLVTSAEASAVTTTYTATNLWAAVATGNVVGVVLRGVDYATPLDFSATGFDSANAATPNVLPALAGASLSTDSFVLRGIARDGTGTFTTPAGHTARVSSNTNAGTVLFSYDTLTVSGTTVAATNVTPSAGDEYVAYSIAFTAIPPAGPKIDTLVNNFASSFAADFTGSGGGAISGGKLSLPIGASINSNIPYDLTESSVYLEVPTPSNTSGDPTETWFSLSRDPALWEVEGVSFRLRRGSLYMQQYAAGVVDSTPITWSATDHRWLKISHTGALITWETSPDGSTWTTQKTAGQAAVLVSLYVNLGNFQNFVIVNDTFTGADSTTSAGALWTNRLNSVGRLSNAAYAPTTTANVTSVATYGISPTGNDMGVGATITGMDGTQECTILLGSNTTGQHIGFMMNSGSGAIRTVPSWGGAVTTRATPTGTHTNGDKYRFTRVGSLCTAYRNGVSIGTWSDTTPVVARDSSHRVTGMYFFHNTTGVGSIRIDDFQIEDLSGTGNTIELDNLNTTGAGPTTPTNLFFF